MVFYIGASTAAHQIEGNNKNSDFWTQEQLPHSIFKEPSLDAVDHYNRYEEDIDLLKEAGLNAYRFSIEWARIEPEKGRFDEKEVAHYQAVIDYCKKNGVEPFVTLHHFSSPKWLITEGGWESEKTVEYFRRYAEYIITQLGDSLNFVCTINEANMGIQLAAIIKRILTQMGINIQVGVNMALGEEQQVQMKENAEAFGLAENEQANTFLSQRTEKGDQIIIDAHIAAREAIRSVNKNIKVGLTLSLHDLQLGDDSEKAKELVAKAWNDEFLHYLPAIEEDDFLGVQNYTREIYTENGVAKVEDETHLTEMGYENYPQALANVIRKVAEVFKKDIYITENGIAASDDRQRVEFIDTVMSGVSDVINEGLPVKGYFHWSLMDNFEWQKGFSMKFGLIEVERATQKRTPKPSLAYLGERGKAFN
ncbi:glycoside hydrolase family 1 [Enterococcus sp. JM4C]|uniref:glycoside hydrolase family 1 protein n=1 Tax=Candidatus Enterococcus huntleyi TaxID=1857217 RepID=UPI00137A0837|nr:family 1 glycosylhydrolase [Enterococcus sp. JM4C]KAF1299071.1 glycoside hydrolase family 1 [Enterococcus sp. JM4C]